MRMPSFLDVYLCFGVISVVHWTVLYVARALGHVPRKWPH